ncbi:hypothetical protein PGTUg99_018372 [Puccinia graminis f. sp. tritici]|uniref:Uncharacterized protein n=1 Tax=Puccinia graminis f. sp. tritici TaxID=56615 RepID=A0A5B0SJV1_PUCGR|nr:hypothetical protein PGTUg99_018372 [Puccinia graminis f. sp. tritici]
MLGLASSHYPRTTHRLNQIEPPISSTNSIQDQSSRFAQLSSPLERRWILSSSLFFVVRGHSSNSQGVLTLDER